MDLLLALIVFGLLIFILVKIFTDNYRKFKMVCKKCGRSSEVKRKLRGNQDLEDLFYLRGIMLGMIYSSWREGKKIYKCPHCGSTDMISADSPKKFN